MNWMLFFSIILFYFILVLVNIPASFIGIELYPDDKPRLWYQPRGIVISAIWFVLFTFLGIARYQLIITENEDAVRWLIFLAIVSAGYVYYTVGLARVTALSEAGLGLLGNVLLMVLTSLVIYKLLLVSLKAALLVLPLLGWTAYASLINIGELTLRHKTEK